MSLTLYIVPHTHWDREWYLPFQEFRVRLVHLMDGLLEILGNDGTYKHFMLDGQTILLEDYLQIRPDSAAEITRFVRLGRLTIGPWYVLPDEFLVAPESLVRNLMLGDRVCSRFGAKMRIGYIPDPFGHVSQLPQILQGFGIETAAFRRGLAEEPAELWWDAPDGSRVLVCYLRDGYDNAARLPTDPDAFVTRIRSIRDSLAPHVVNGHVLLLAGTDHQEPQPELPALIAYANDGRLDGDRLIHSSLPDYVAALREALGTQRAPRTGSLNTIKGELRSPQRHYLLPGVLSTRMWIKQRNDAMETLLTRWAEPFAAWAELVDSPASLSDEGKRTHLTGHESLRRVRHSGALIWHAWRILLENHPHDSICGCSVDQVHREMSPRFDQVEQIAEQVAAQSLRAVAEQVDTRQSEPVGRGRTMPLALVVFNPVDGPRTDVVTGQLWLPSDHDALDVIGSDGQALPHQVLADPSRVERSLFHVEATPAEVAAYIGLIQGGRLMNHAIHQIQLHKAGDQVEVLVIMSESGEPDHEHLTAARAQIERIVASGGVSRFILRGLLAGACDLAFVAPNLPAYGYATFTVRPRQGARGSNRSDTSGTVLENDLFSVTADPADGTLILTDKMTGLVYPGLNRFVNGGDRGDEYNYCQPEQDRIVGEPIGPPTIKVIECGPARRTLEIAQIYRVPRSLQSDRRGRLEETIDLPIVSRVSLYPGVRRVDIETTLENQARDHRMRVHFPVPVQVDHAYTDAHYYVARRSVPQTTGDLDTGDWVEQPVSTEPQRGWSALSDGRVGLLVANRGLPEVEFIPDDNQTIIALTLLRCVGWLSRDDMHCRQGHAGPELPTPEAQCLGRHTFHYALVPYADAQWEQVRAEAEAFRAPLRAVTTGVHAGPLPPATSLVQVEPSSFILTTIKQPEERSTPGLIVRGVNMSDQPIIVHLRPWRRFDRIARVNLNEEFVEPLLAATDGTVTIPVPPWGIVTIRWSEA